MMVCIVVRLVFMFCFVMVSRFVLADVCCVSSVIEYGLFLKSGSIFVYMYC